MMNPSPPLRVTFVIQNLAGLGGGAERVFIETAEAMAARGMEVSILCFDPRQAPVRFGRGSVEVRNLFPPGAPRAVSDRRAKNLLKSLPDVFPLTHLKWAVSHGLFARRLRRALRLRPADVVVAFLPPAITAAAWATRGTGTPLIASTHNVPERDFGNSGRWDQNPLYRKRARQALAEAARVTVLLPEFASWFPTRMRGRVVVMPNPVARIAAPAPTGQTAPPGHTILGIGRLAPVKRWDMLIAAFAPIAADLPEWQVRIYGEGEERNRLQGLIDALDLADRVHLMGLTDSLGAEYDRAALLVHPAEFEGFGLSVAEAMAHGVPVIAFADCPGVNSLIRHPQDGLLISRGSDKEACVSLAAAMLDLARDPERRQMLGRAAAAITARYDPRSIHDHWAEMLHGQGRG